MHKIYHQTFQDREHCELNVDPASEFRTDLEFVLLMAEK